MVILRRVLAELKRRFQIEHEVPEKPEALRSAFANWLHMAAARGRVVLVLDALNQLEDRDGAPDLVWLPPVMPGNVRLIISTLSGRPLAELTKREWPTLVVEPFEEEERRRFIDKYLVQYAKSLSAERSERIASAPAAANPLYVQVLLEELRVFGSHERLEERLEHYLTARTVDGLYELLADLSFFAAAWKASEFEVKAHWAHVERGSEFRMVDAYRSLLDDQAAPEVSDVWLVGSLLGDTGHLAEALALREHLVALYREAGDQANLSASLGNQAVILAGHGDLDGAMALHREEEQICRERGDKHGLLISLVCQALLLSGKLNRRREALPLAEECDRLCTECGFLAEAKDVKRLLHIVRTRAEKKWWQYWR